LQQRAAGRTQRPFCSATSSDTETLLAVMSEERKLREVVIGA
jgi:hypothetical protein